MHCLKNMSKPLPSPKASILCVADVFQVTWSPSCLSLRYITEMHWPYQEGLGRGRTGTTRQSKSQNQNVFSTFSHSWNAHVSPFWSFFSRWLKWRIYSFNACSCIWSSFILWPSWIWFGNSRNVWWLFRGILWCLSQGDTQRKRL